MTGEKHQQPRMSLGRFFIWFGLLPAAVAVLAVLIVERDPLSRGGYARQNAVIALIMLPLLLLALCPIAHYVFCVPGAMRKKPLWRSVGEILLTVIFLPWSVYLLILLDNHKRRPVRTRSTSRSWLNRPIYSLDGRLWWAPIAIGWLTVARRVLITVNVLAQGIAPELYSVFLTIALAGVMIWVTVYLSRRRRRAIRRMRQLVAPPLPVSPPSSSAPARVRPRAEIDWTTPILSEKARKARQEKLRKEAGGDVAET